ncbi:hypothetical protein ALI22I_01230 [Saccharothrix sp. ALI-22-I]|nr:hypothetical protein ALI22I_01230 [Saccharothrix sp. ALI-22-I]
MAERSRRPNKQQGQAQVAVVDDRVGDVDLPGSGGVRVSRYADAIESIRAAASIGPATRT